MVNTNIKVVEMAIGLLEAMDESVVARRAAELIKQSLSVVKGATVLESGPTSVTIEHPQFYPFGPENLEQEFNDDVSNKCFHLSRVEVLIFVIDAISWNGVSGLFPSGHDTCIWWTVDWV